MLNELFIRNLAIIDELRLRFDAGFNVLTGETGAGKSIILDAVMLILGGRADTSLVRAGCDEAYVEAMFALDGGTKTAVLPILEAQGLEDEDESDAILLTRELRMNGRNICRVNGRAVSLSVLREVAEPLIDIHGQGEHLSLLKPSAHLPVLDAYARVDGDRTAVAKEVTALNAIRRELASLRQDERMLAQRMDMLRFQIEEIRAANLQPDEEEELRTERTRLANAEQLAKYALEAGVLLSGVDDDSASVTELLSQAERALMHLVRLDETKTEMLTTLQGLSSQFSDLAADVADYREQLEFNPQRLNEVEERLEVINRLKRKYGNDIAAILATAVKAEAELDKITHSEERIEALQKEQEQYLRRIGKLALVLSDKRKEAAGRLGTAVERELADLSMVGARFSVEFETEAVADGAPVQTGVGQERLKFDQTGFDQVQFLMSANPGEPLKPMAKVASGGETARLMLALKTALAQVDSTPTLIFDEIDQGIGGRVGDVVGRKLWGLSAIAQHQVIVVTHLPQLAGYGDVHFHVSKRVSEGRTATAVSNLDERARIQELAAMLGTQAKYAREGAASILQQVAQVKSTARQ
ncbi:MAG: DNA repair protein RecN [Ardenticatenaceae bacterium]|nr:DNA repair protein RecN [Ardenticatenaceae bacterium]